MAARLGTYAEAGPTGRKIAMSHPDDHLLDQYALGRITDECQLASIEEHLLICEECQESVKVADAIRVVFGKPVPLAGN